MHTTKAALRVLHMRQSTPRGRSSKAASTLNADCVRTRWQACLRYCGSSHVSIQVGIHLKWCIQQCITNVSRRHSPPLCCKLCPLRKVKEQPSSICDITSAVSSNRQPAFRCDWRAFSSFMEKGPLCMGCVHWGPRDTPNHFSDARQLEFSTAPAFSTFWR